MLQLALDVAEHTAGAESEVAIGSSQERPSSSFMSGEPVERLLRGADAAGGFEADGYAGALGVVADRADHDERNGQRGVDGFFAGGSFDEVSAGHHGDPTGAATLRRVIRSPVPRMVLRWAWPAGIFEGSDLVVESLPLRRSKRGRA